jgi:hypothetical protein
VSTGEWQAATAICLLAAVPLIIVAIVKGWDGDGQVWAAFGMLAGLVALYSAASAWSTARQERKDREQRREWERQHLEQRVDELEKKLTKARPGRRE